METPELIHLYHFHVYIVQVNYSGFAGVNVGRGTPCERHDTLGKHS